MYKVKDKVFKFLEEYKEKNNISLIPIDFILEQMKERKVQVSFKEIGQIMRDFGCSRSYKHEWRGFFRRKVIYYDISDISRKKQRFINQKPLYMEDGCVEVVLK